MLGTKVGVFVCRTEYWGCGGGSDNMELRVGCCLGGQSTGVWWWWCGGWPPVDKVPGRRGAL